MKRTDKRNNRLLSVPEPQTMKANMRSRSQR